MLLALFVIGCAGTKPFNNIVRPGETVAIPGGYLQNVNAGNIKVTITPDIGSVQTYLPGNAAIRAITNMYIDPLASIVMSRETNQDLTPNARSYAISTANLFTGVDKDWWQTAIFVDVPSTFDPSATMATITVDDTGLGGPETESVSMEVGILNQSGGSRHNFNAQILGPMTPNQLASLRRVDHYTVSFSGSTVPQAIQIDMAHDPDVDSGGVGRAYVVNPIGYIKNTAWHDDGINMRVILTPTRDSVISTMTDFKFYVAGGVTGLFIPTNGVQAFDIDGNAVPGVTASID